MITASDIKLLESEIMSDTTDAGGRRTSRVIPDGVAGNIFPKVSRLDSVYGRVNLRKVYGSVQTANRDTYAGSHAVITDAPDNSKIHCALFSTGSEFDTRTTARDRIESYVTSGPESRMILVGRQLPGQQSILAYQRIETPIPEIGDVYCLSNEPSGVVTHQQYVRVQDVTHEVRTYTDGAGDFQRRVVTIDIGAALRYEFNGPETPDRISSVARVSKVRSTTVVDASRYYGVQKLSAPADTNDLEVMVGSVYTPVVPTTTRESAVSNEALSLSGAVVPASPSSITEAVVSGWPVGVSRFTSRPITRGTLTLSGGGVTPVTDDGSGVVSDSTFSAIIDYEAGVITRTGGSGGNVTPQMTYVPGGAVAHTVHTLDTLIQINNRGVVYSFTLHPLPAVSSVFIDYRALGKWYRLRDKGDGTIGGDDPAYGTGRIDYTTGSVVATLGALPDIDTAVIFSWASPVTTEVRVGSATTPTITTMLSQEGVARNSLEVTYISGGLAKVAHDEGTGLLKVGATTVGSVKYATGVIQITDVVDSGTNIVSDYEYGDPLTTVFHAPGRNPGPTPAVGTVTITIPGAPLEVYSIRIQWNTDVELYDPATRVAAGRVDPIFTANDDGAGNLVLSSGAIVGTVNYSTGVATFHPDQVSSIPVLNYGWVNRGPVDVYQFTHFTYVPAGCIAPPTFDVSVSYRSVDSLTAANETTPASLKFKAVGSYTDDIIPTSFMFSYNGRTYVDRSGSLYYGVSTTTGSGMLGGTVNYSTGEVVITSWGSNPIPIQVLSCLTVYGDHSANSVAFRVPGSPLRPGSFYVQVTTLDGVSITATSNNSGDISTSKMIGSVDQETGVVRLKFGELVAAAGNETKAWYKPENVVGGYIFRPLEVVPSTLRYNCVVLANLPLNADVLGLDPVRLPMDGRVPIYRAADVVVIHNTQSTTLPNPVVAGSTYSVGRSNLSEIWVTDQQGVKLSSGQYSVNLVTGNVTMAADFVAGALVQPLIAKHRIEDMTLLTDVQINGQLTLASPLPRAYPLDSYVSSALLFGDMNGRVTNVFDLAAFASWSDTPETGSNAQYNNIDYPIEVLNNGAVTERWRISFTTTTSFQVIGENLGVIATGSIASDCSPTNQLTGLPYFVIRAAGWGSGWSAGNQLRFNTISAAAPIWIARTILPGATLDGDSFSMQMRGDVDAE